MICSEFRDHVESLVDELLPPEEADRLRAHAERCADCAAEIRSEASVSSARATW